MKKQSLETQLTSFMAKYTPEIRAEADAVLAWMRARLPGAVQMVYDNYNALVVGFGPTERPSEVVFSIALYPRWVTLFFLHGARLPDPHRLLKGSGKQVRNIRLDEPDTLDRPAVRELIAAALDRSPLPIDASAPGPLIIKSISAKQRPRRPTSSREVPCEILPSM